MYLLFHKLKPNEVIFAVSTSQWDPSSIIYLVVGTTHSFCGGCCKDLFC